MDKSCCLIITRIFCVARGVIDIGCKRTAGQAAGAIPADRDQGVIEFLDSFLLELIASALQLMNTDFLIVRGIDRTQPLRTTLDDESGRKSSEAFVLGNDSWLSSKFFTSMSEGRDSSKPFAVTGLLRRNRRLPGFLQLCSKQVLPQVSSCGQRCRSRPAVATQFCVGNEVTRLRRRSHS